MGAPHPIFSSTLSSFQSISHLLTLNMSLYYDVTMYYLSSPCWNIKPMKAGMSSRLCSFMSTECPEQGLAADVGG